MQSKNTRQQLSIHGRDASGKLAAGKYNPNPIPQGEPSNSPRAVRRRAARKGK